MLKIYHNDKLLEEYSDSTPIIIFDDDGMKLLAHKDVEKTEDSRSLFHLAAALHLLCGEDDKFIEDVMNRAEKLMTAKLDTATNIIQ